MAGTYLQQDAYGDIPGARPLFKESMSDDQLIDLVRSEPAVAHARNSCDWVVATALYQEKAAVLRPPQSAKSACWLAFVDREEHSAVGWSKVAIVLFHRYERNENIFKVILPAVLPQQQIVFVNHALPQARCLGMEHLIRSKDLAKGMAPHLFASRIPGWSGRAVLPGYLEMAKGYLERRNASSDLEQYEEQVARMTRTGFNVSHRFRVVDTLWMIWPAADHVAERMSRLWLHEVARHSSLEKVSYPWVCSRVPAFRAKLVDAVYIYAPAQRVCPASGDNASILASGKTPRRARIRAKRRGRRLGL